MHVDRVEVIIGGRVHSRWSRYEIDSDLLTPADAWSVSLEQEELQVPAAVRDAWTAEIRVGGEVVMSGWVDAQRHTVSKGLHHLQLSGRDGAAQLLDCSAPIWSSQDLSLEQVIARIVRPLGVAKIRLEARQQALRERVAVEPGESGWEALQRAAEVNGLWPWFEPDGTLVVGGPDYSQAPVDHLVMRRDGRGNNVMEATEQNLPSERFSHVTVLGQAHATEAREGRNAVKATSKDTGVMRYRPRLVIDHEAVNETLAATRARKVTSDARVRGYELTLQVRGHRTSAGQLWAPGQRVHAVIEALGIDGVFFVMARRFTGLPKMTTLSLREDGAWVLSAKPQSVRRRAAGRKKATPSGRILDVVGGQP